MTIQVIDRAVALLALIARDGSASVLALGRELKLPASTVARILASLAQHGLLEQSSDRRYRLGARIVALASTVQSTRTLVEHARPLLDQLARNTREDSRLAILQGDQAVIVDCVYGPHPLKIIEPLSEPVTLNCGFRRVLLAYQSDQWIEDYLSRTRMVPYTGFTTTDKEEIRAKVREVRDRGYAISRSENVVDAGGVAAPVFDAQRQMVASLFVTVPLTRFNVRRIRELTSHVVAAAGELTQRLKQSMDLPISQSTRIA